MTLAPTTVRTFAFAATLASASLASAHEFWLQPDDFTPASNSIVRLHLMVGDGFPGEVVARNPDKLLRLTALTTGGAAEIPGRPGADPAGMMRVAGDDMLTVVYLSGNSSVSLDAQKFEDYLKTDGLEHVIARRAELGQSALPGREVYARCSKSLLRVGAGASEGFALDAGLPLELFPLSNPYDLAPGDAISFRLDYLDAPLADRLVVARRQSDPATLISARTDSRGQVSLTLPDAGMWLISSVHMVPAADDANADWQSYWASFTFDLQPASAASVDK